MDSGTEIRLFDSRRNPHDWTDLLGQTDCAVFLKNRKTSASLTPDGRLFDKSLDTTCVVFGCLDAARRYCEAKVQVMPHVRCEIYDSEGLAHPPLLVIVHPSFDDEEESSSRWSRRRKLIAGGLVVFSAAPLWMAAHRSDDFLVFLACTCILLAMRFLYWDFGLKHREAETRKRLEAHLMKKRGDG